MCWYGCNRTSGTEHDCFGRRDRGCRAMLLWLGPSGLCCGRRDTSSTTSSETECYGLTYVWR